MAVQPESELSQECDAASREEQANARLIAAAPELLAALQSIIDIPEPHVVHERELEMRNIARAAISKATGTL